jgi:signal transduction histidine kinase
MSLHQFLIDHRQQILSESESRTIALIALAALRPSSEHLRSGLPIFLDQLIAVLAKEIPVIGAPEELQIMESAGSHGKELLRLGYTLTHVVHSYGAMCQAITEIASKTKAAVTALEFHHLNRCLDIAIAGAVTEFETVSHLASKNLEAIHLGTIAHELRNALNRSRISFEMLSKGMVGLGGSTSRVLERSLEEMDMLINRSLSEVRLRSESVINEEYFTIIQVISQILVTAEIEAARRQQVLAIDIDPKIGVKTDRHLFSAAIGNLVQNAMKFSKVKGVIEISAQARGTVAVIEVQDQCGGISEEKMAQLFKPFVMQHNDTSGLGLGLIISKEAIEKCKGTLTVRNEKSGCVFTIELPLFILPTEPEHIPVV